MKHTQLPKRPWVLAAFVAIMVVGHGVVFYEMSSHIRWTVALVVALLVLLKHVGVFGPIYTFFKRKSRHQS